MDGWMREWMDGWMVKVINKGADGRWMGGDVEMWEGGWMDDG